ncbi:Fe-S-containing hydro-lyase [Mailhella massiliensis]|uniref:Fe-S-containing hydro-lyase n=1 Tax=Mailhella massiliensis TaxID=1903261 RepID=UPI00097DE03B|nr:Fe-S-containing hydro-lyase [Mailhella massiliensis]
MPATHHLTTPLSRDDIRSLHIGDLVFISGTIYAARDAAHKRMVEALDEGRPLPFEPAGQLIYYVGPTPAKPGRPIGSAGPTTSGRMDAYTPRLLSLGLAGMIGKGNRSRAVMDSIKENVCVYFAATGGAAALISRCIRSYTVLAWPELGPEALAAMEVENFPVTVVADCFGGDQYEEGQKPYRKI